MKFEPEQLASLSAICEKAEIMTEGGCDYIYLRELKVRVDGVSYATDALLCPQTHGGYETRLFLSQPIPGHGQNWTIHQILSRRWHTWSWQGVPPSLPLFEMLLAHLVALR